MDRIAVFIDNSNIFKGFKKFNIKADYEKLKNKLAQNRKLTGIYLYEGVVYPLSPNKKKWYNDLKNISGYDIKTSFDKQVSNSAIEKKIDIQIAIDIISLAYEDKYDTAVLVSGDGDFIPVVKKLKDLKKNVELWAFKYSLANALREELNDEQVFYLDNVLNDIKIN